MANISPALGQHAGIYRYIADQVGRMIALQYTSRVDDDYTIGYTVGLTVTQLRLAYCVTDN